ncbi:precorrin-2 dehydrogenase/sirohydrochlorin ferrochelatase family protein [Caldanaerobius polysaccharolyticus]|uniref:precorrin-2 dehydrogenase/sirohydrochlorin ferrochelatase family protein n=1 Tax=Caldanaerobius polysaccharolyticus TaxID=44256 RepID=UPI00047D9FDA|nr:bifunctional precorrin-2 dehydrogenase/sirohydrochlorin ferrochelatase [Caldanaerobius polysaccharolyticus]
MAYYPVMLDIADKKCLVVGGGAVAERKVKDLVGVGARVTVISPEITQGIAMLHRDGFVDVVMRRYRSGDVDGYSLVIAATGDKVVNQQVYKEARDKGVLINTVDQREMSTFISPAVLRKGDIVIAISTSGKSPLLAKELKKFLDEIISEEVAEGVKELGDVREKAKRQFDTLEARTGYYREVLKKHLKRWLYE